MKLEMTERDKKLLIGLAIGVIIVCIGYWGIFPIIKDIGTIQEEIEVQDAREQVNSMKQLQLPMLEVDNETYEKDILEARAGFYKILTSDEIDKIFTGKALSHNLYAYEMNITMPTAPAKLEPYQYSQKALYGEEEEEDDGWAIAGDTTTSSDDLFGDFEEDEDTTGIYAATVSMRLGGEQEDLNAFLNELAAEGIKIRLCSYSFTDNRNVVYGQDSGYEVVVNRTLNVVLEIYMCEE